MLTRLEEIRHEITGERLTLIEFARKLRQDATVPEALLWACLRNRRMNKRKRHPQHRMNLLAS
jgi:very-short-patch-repair endonuclease